MTSDWHTDEQIQRAAKLAEELDPSGLEPDDVTDLRAIAQAVDSGGPDDARIGELVASARANGRSWGQIGIALDMHREAARKRFGEKGGV